MAAIVQCNAILRSSNLANEITINMSRIGALQLPQNDKSFASLKTVALTSTLKLAMFPETMVGVDHQKAENRACPYCDNRA